jgi:hypothetical protein
MAMILEVDISGLPLFYVNKIITTKMDDGQRDGRHCGFKRGSILAPQFIAVLPAPELVMINRDIREAVSRILLGGNPEVGLLAH